MKYLPTLLRYICCLLGVVIALTQPSFLFSQSIWNADAVNGTSDWAIENNWLGGLPSAEKTVVINACTICPIVTKSPQKAGYVQIKDGGKLTIANNGHLSIENQRGSALKAYEGASVIVNQGGQLTIQSFMTEGLIIEGSLRNAGTINIQNGAIGIYVHTEGGISNQAGGTISIDGKGLQFGITSNGNCVNNGQINIKNALVDGINQAGGLFINGRTSLLSIVNAGVNAIFSKGNFNNNGKIEVDDSYKGIFSINGTFNNNAGSQLHIKGTNKLYKGIYAGQTIFNNTGEIVIDSAMYCGIEVSDSASFNNRHKINLNIKGAVGILNVGQSRFFNQPCAFINSNATIINYAAFSNKGNILESSNSSSMISENEGNIFNLNGGSFQVSTGEQAFDKIQHVWTGCVSSDWNNIDNWAAHTLPVAEGNNLAIATIPDVSAYLGNEPIISSEIRLSNLNLQEKAGLTIANIGSLTITALLQTPVPLILNKSSRIIIETGSRLTAYKIINKEGLISNTGTIRVTGIGVAGGIDNQKGTINNNGIITNTRLTNNGDCLNQKEWYNSEFIINENTFSNNGILTANKGIGLQNKGEFNNYTEGVVSINNVERGIETFKTFINSGSITIDGTTDVGIDVQGGEFINSRSGRLSIKYTQQTSFMVSGNLTNSGVITIANNYHTSLVVIGMAINRSSGQISHNQINNGMIVMGNFENQGRLLFSDSKNRGIEVNTFGSFTNEIGGFIEINQTRTDGIAILSTLNNRGNISILYAGSNGLNNTGTVTNETNGIIDILNAGSQGILNTSSLKNSGKITVKNAEVQGIVHQNGTIDNTATGQILISAIGLNGLINRAVINNEGQITAENSTLNDLFNQTSGILNNLSCGTISLAERFRNTGIINNKSLFRLISGDFVTNSGSFNNESIIEDRLNVLDGIPYIQQAMRARPLSGTAGSAINNALDVANNLSLDISPIWYKNANLTDSVATYNQSNNTLTTSLAAGTHTLYFKVTHPASNCQQTVSLTLTLSGTIAETNRFFVSKQPKSAVIYPNPVSTELYINLSDNNISEQVLQIFDISGKQIFRQVIQSGQTQFGVDVQNFAAGIYLLSIEQKGQKAENHRFVVKK